MCKKSHKIKTYCIQYANLGFTTPLMISPVDNYLCFSKYYESVFKWKDIMPSKFISCGYSYTSFDIDPNMLLIKEDLNPTSLQALTFAET